MCTCYRGDDPDNGCETCVECEAKYGTASEKTEIQRLTDENRDLVTHVYSLLDAGKFAKWDSDISEANWGISALAAKKTMESSAYAKSI